jgi:protocatechuate 3,4-dioxygenase beta subunit
MNRRTFLGLAIGLLFLPRRAGADCWLTPQETAGPFWFDPHLDRSNITEGRTGIPLRLALTLVDAQCKPIEGARIDVWHCDKDGLYSGYEQPEGDTSGEKFLRGSQATDASGNSRFTTIYPGWYAGRATHIHFKARAGATAYVTSQFAFPDAVNDAVYKSALYKERGRNPTRTASDGIFRSGDLDRLVLKLAADGRGGYDASYRIGVATGGGGR